MQNGREMGVLAWALAIAAGIVLGTAGLAILGALIGAAVALIGFALKAAVVVAIVWGVVALVRCAKTASAR